MALRDLNSYSVILGVFFNAGYDKTVTLAQVFWLKDANAQPHRLLTACERDLSIANDFSGFGKEMSGLRKQLRAKGVELFDTFPPYGSWFRRRFGINNEQALDLFHQNAEITALREQTEEAETRAQNELNESGVNITRAQAEHDQLQRELTGLKSRISNIDEAQIVIRRSLCEALALNEASMPFAGELLLSNCLSLCRSLAFMTHFWYALFIINQTEQSVMGTELSGRGGIQHLQCAKSGVDPLTKHPQILVKCPKYNYERTFLRWRATYW